MEPLCLPRSPNHKTWRGQPTYSSQKAKLETRGPWVLTGRSMPLFLIIVGSTGSVLAFYHALDHWLNPKLRAVPVREAPLLDTIDLITLRERAAAPEPRQGSTGSRALHCLPQRFDMPHQQVGPAL